MHNTYFNSVLQQNVSEFIGLLNAWHPNDTFHIGQARTFRVRSMSQKLSRVPDECVDCFVIKMRPERIDEVWGQKTVLQTSLLVVVVDLVSEIPRFRFS